jgi:predicted methyltransferase
MRTLALTLAALLATSVAACSTAGSPANAQQAAKPSAAIDAAVADAARPAADKERDANRKPAEMLAFAEVQPGDKIGELIPAGGYFTRIFSKAVGPKGKLYGFAGPPRPNQPPTLDALVKDATNYPNIQVVETDFVTLKSPEPLDLVWTSQNYHDLHNPGRNIDINKANKAIFDALKPGGVYIVLDHQSAPGVDFSADMHRIDSARVKAEVLAAGFQFVGESNAIRNPADPKDKTVFDPAFRGKTDQFILKFRKPG